MIPSRQTLEARAKALGIDPLRMRAFFAVQQGAEHWPLIRDLAARIDALETRLAEIESERPRVDVEPERSSKHGAKT